MQTGQYLLTENNFELNNTMQGMVINKNELMEANKCISDLKT